jgi:2'-5' RNA ligase
MGIDGIIPLRYVPSLMQLHYPESEFIREVDNEESSNALGPETLERFRKIQRIHNHWSRPAAPRSYYWYLTFEQFPQLHSLTAECQKAISFPYYDLTPVSELHLTLDRIALDGDITPEQLKEIEAIAMRTCQKIQPFNITIGYLSGTAGAIGFTAYPTQSIRILRDAFRAATLSVYPDAPVRDSGFHPHVTIAYGNSDDVPATDVIAIVEELNATASVGVTITEGVLVSLERRPRSYAWQAISRIPLAQRSCCA